MIEQETGERTETDDVVALQVGMYQAQLSLLIHQTSRRGLHLTSSTLFIPETS